MPQEPLQFVEQNAQERGFGAFFANRILPELDRLEERRQRTKTNALIFIVASVVIGLWMIVMAGPKGADGLLIGLVPVVAGAVFARNLVIRYRNRFAETINPLICEFVGIKSYSRKPQGFDLTPFHQLGLVGLFRKSSLEDYFEGTYRKTHFQMVEARLKKPQSSDNNQQVTTFKGLLFVIDAPVQFSGRVLIAKDPGVIGRALQDLFKISRPFETGNKAFDDLFEIHAENEGLVKKLVPKGFQDTLVTLSHAFGSQSLTAAFYDSKFYMAVPVSMNLFEGGHLFRNVCKDEECFHHLLAQVSIPERVIDHLCGDCPPITV